MKRRAPPAVETRLQKRRRQSIVILDELWTEEIMARLACRENTDGLTALIRLARTCRAFYNGPWRRYVTFLGGVRTEKLTDATFLPFAPYLTRFEYTLPCHHVMDDDRVQNPALMACTRLTHLKLQESGCYSGRNYRHIPPSITHLDLADCITIWDSAILELPNLQCLRAQKGIYYDEDEKAIKMRFPHADITFYNFGV
jgi:hypothetical protein